MSTSFHGQTEFTYISSGIPIILPRLHTIRLIARNQQRAAIERRRESRDNRIRLGIRASLERTARAAEDIPSTRSRELATAAEAEDPVHPDLPARVPEPGLRVDRQARVRVAIVHFVDVVGPVRLEPGWVEQDAGVRAQDAQ